jgi:hypothetical protein
LTFKQLMPESKIRTILLDDKGNILNWQQAGKNGTNYLYMRGLNKGTYYVKLLLLDEQQRWKYNIMTNTEALISGFRDISNHWAKSAIISLTSKKIVQGYEDFAFSPNRSLTRAEAVVLLVRAFKLNQIEKISFKDVKSNHWAYDEIAKGVGAQVISGYADESFRPDQPIKRAEMSIMLFNAMKLSKIPVIIRPFRDVSVKHPGAIAISRLKSASIMRGFENGLFYPDNSSTRAQFASILQLALSK